MRICKEEGCDQETRSPRDTLCVDHRKAYQQARARAAQARMRAWRAKRLCVRQLRQLRQL